MEATTTDEPMRLAARIGNFSVLFDMQHVSEIIATPTPTPVPWTQAWFRGLCNVRGRLIGVIDLQQFCGSPPLTADRAQQLIVLNEALKIQAGILISRAFGLRKLGGMQQVAQFANAQRPWEIALYRDAQGETLTEIDLACLIKHDMFKNIGI
jgi:twitching motility protein PilI